MQPSDVHRDELTPAPITPEHVRAGAPEGRSLRLSESPDGRLVTDLWDCTAGVFDWYFDADEIAHILDGEVRVAEDSGRVVVLRTGDVAQFRRGAHTVWTVPRHVRKLAVNRRLALPLSERGAALARRLRMGLGGHPAA